MSKQLPTWMRKQLPREIEHTACEIDLMRTCDLCDRLVKGPIAVLHGFELYACGPCVKEYA